MCGGAEMMHRGGERVRVRVGREGVGVGVGLCRRVYLRFQASLRSKSTEIGILRYVSRLKP